MRGTKYSTFSNGCGIIKYSLNDGGVTKYSTFSNGCGIIK